ncbi:hypothetical protein COO60DRAFT_1624994 [Scenedesmus sp. NREL 46B-D3]|nr:hypothetical protein COO60DRAFT_1624994 [Scenedesmus sp. NREL 46B-D3]
MARLQQLLSVRCWRQSRVREHVANKRPDTPWNLCFCSPCTWQFWLCSLQAWQQPALAMMPTIEMPTVKKEDAGCVNKCSNECTVSLKQTCTMVPVTNKECATVTKTTTTKKCHKKCCVDIPVPAPATAPAAANPSAPAAAAAAPATAAADISFSMPSLHGKGRKLAAAQGLPFIKALFGSKQSSQPAAVCKCVPMQKVTVTLPGHSFGHMG